MDFWQHAAMALAPHINCEPSEAREMLEAPPADMGDIALPCFKLAKKLRKAPPVIAAELAAAIPLPEGFSSIQAAGGYLNFTIDRAAAASTVLEQIRQQGDRYGSSDEGQQRVVCIDYSSINISKRFHIGHLYTTALGHALYNLYNFLGYRSVGINHLGDWGTQFGKLISAYKRWGSREMVEQGGLDALTELYVRFDGEAEKQPELNDDARSWFRRIEDGDPDVLELFEWFKEITLADAMRVYDVLGIKFDSYAGESFYTDKMGPVVDELREKGLLIKDQGAHVVFLDEWNMPPCIILKSDGATLYATRDIATAKYRKATYDFYKSLYVVASHQILHFQQIFRTLNLMGYEWSEDCVHVAYGMVSYEGQSLSTRKGHIVYLDELIDRSVEKSLAIINEKTPELPGKEAIARQVGVGAVVFFALQYNRIRDIDFRWERALNFDGETAPYVQYCHARANSVLEKAGRRDLSGAVDYTYLTDDACRAVVGLLAAFPNCVHQAVENYEPALLTRHMVDLAQAFNRYYYEQRILDGNEVAEKARLTLVDSVRTVLHTGLTLLGIPAPIRM